MRRLKTNHIVNRCGNYTHTRYVISMGYEASDKIGHGLGCLTYVQNLLYTLYSILKHTSAFSYQADNRPIKHIYPFYERLSRGEYNKSAMWVDLWVDLLTKRTQGFA